MTAIELCKNELCPFCESDNVTDQCAGEVRPGRMERDGRCRACGREWRDVYDLGKVYEVIEHYAEDGDIDGFHTVEQPA